MAEATDQIIDTAMACAPHADACRDFALVAWVVMRDPAAYPDLFTVQLVTKAPCPYILVGDSLAGFLPGYRFNRSLPKLGQALTSFHHVTGHPGQAPRLQGEACVKDNVEPNPELAEIVACPRCLAGLEQQAGRWHCGNPDCGYATAGFPSAAGQPALIDFERSVFRRDDYQEAPASLQPASIHRSGPVRANAHRGWRDQAREIILGTNRMADRHAAAMLRDLKTLSPTPRLLVIGGGTLGAGTDIIYNDPAVRVVGTDIYPSQTTSLLADAHCLPFRDGVFDGVWIQAVLEHVLEPAQVVAQIHRVLKPHGLVYAETPFLCPVHMAAHDFTRFTLSGYRWLFRRFEQIDAGVLSGAGSATLWSVRFLWRALGVGDKAATLLTLPVFWLRYLDKLMRSHPNADAALGLYFLGRKAETTLRPRDIIAYYQTQ